LSNWFINYILYLYSVATDVISLPLIYRYSVDKIGQIYNLNQYSAKLKSKKTIVQLNRLHNQRKAFRF